MKISSKYIVHFLLATLLLISACSQDDTSKIEEGKDITLKFSLSAKRTTKATIEIGDVDLNENKIKTLDVFIYEENGDECVYYQHIIPTPEVTGTGEYSVTLNTTQDAFSLNVSYSIYLVANYMGTIPADGISLSTLKTLQVDSMVADNMQEAFIMDGIYTMILNDGVVINKEIPVSLKRAAAKIRVKINYINGYTQTGTNITKRIINYASTSKLLESADAIEPVLLTQADYSAQTFDTGNTGDIIFYSYANDWNDDTNKETYFAINIPVEDSQGTTHLLNYYRIPINYRLPSDIDNPNSTPEEEEARKALYRLERNRLYDITIVLDKLGSEDPGFPVDLTSNYIIQDWSTKDVLVAVEGANFLYVKDTDITLPNKTTYTTSFQSSSPDVEIDNIRVNGVTVSNGSSGVQISWAQNVKSGNIVINSTAPVNFVEKSIVFTVRNGAGLTQDVSVTQFPSFYLSSDISADAPGGSEGQDNRKMYIITSLVADYSTLQNPDEFDEDLGAGYYHYDPDPELGASYAAYIRESAVLGYPKTDSNGATIDTDENNRRISPRFMLASQHGTTTPASYTASKTKCIDYVENDETTGERYDDWRMPTLAEIYMIDILQNTRISEVKHILEGHYYWSSRAGSSVKFMDPRVGSGAVTNPLNAAVRCVRDVKN